MTPPPRPSSGSGILPWCGRLLDYVLTLRPIAGPGLQIRETSNGTIISIAPAGKVTTAKPPIPLHILASRPAYLPAPVLPPAEGFKRYYIEWGALNSAIASNWNDHFDVTVTTYFFVKATLRTTDTMRITTWEIVTGPAEDSYVTADWLIGENRPANAYYLLGGVIVDGSNHSIVNSGGGSLALTEHVTDLEPDDLLPGGVKFGKSLVFIRQPFYTTIP